MLAVALEVLALVARFFTGEADFTVDLTGLTAFGLFGAADFFVAGTGFDGLVAIIFLILLANSMPFLPPVELFFVTKPFHWRSSLCRVSL